MDEEATTNDVPNDAVNSESSERPASEWSMFFRDGTTRVDFVLAYNAAETDPVRLKKREIFELNLLAESLLLEREEIQKQLPEDQSAAVQQNGEEISEAVNAEGDSKVQIGSESRTVAEGQESVGYLKVHAPFEVLAKYAEALKMHMPVKQNVNQFVQNGSRVLKTADCRFLLEQHAVESNAADQQAEVPKTRLHKVLQAMHLYPDLQPIHRRLAVPFSMHRAYLFDIEQQDDFFTQKDRSYVVDYILQRKSYTRLPTELDSALTCVAPPEQDESKQTTPAHTQSCANAPENEMGISRLLQDRIYLAAFPLHDCPLTSQHRVLHNSEFSECMRNQLWREWADFRNAIKFQPIHHIQRYFGDAIAWYFAWLGFYTWWLIPLSLIGLVIFIYGVAVAYDSKAEAFCKANSTMCPLCLRGCPYWQMSSQCINVTMRRIFENALTFVWGIVVTLWCTLFLENWKRTQFTLQFEWSLFGVEKDEEPPRPDFSALSQRFRSRPHPITGRLEPHVPFWTALVPHYAVSVVTVLFGMLLVLAAVGGVVVYRIVMQTLTFQSGSAFFNEFGPLVASATGAMVNLLCIMLLGLVYNSVAKWLTDKEYWRTQSEYDNALMAKLVALQCVNYYSPIVYTAFLKGQFASVSDYASLANANRTDPLNVDFTIDVCPSGSCLPDLCVQLIIIMCYKQLIQNNVLEILLPKVQKKLRNYLKKRRMRKSSDGLVLPNTLMHDETTEMRTKFPSLVGNFKLQEVGPRPLFSEYLEMIIQYGFVSIFAIAFPLAPLFALLNNIIEIRLDARKFLVELRRPVAMFDADVGIWYKVLFLLSRIAVVTNGALIAFTSEFVPNYVYKQTWEYSNGTHVESAFNYELYTSFAYAVLNTSVLEQAGASARRAMKFRNGSTVELDPGTCLYKGFNNPPDVAPPALPYAPSKVYWHVLAWRIATFVLFENAILILTELVAYMIPDVPKSVEEKQRKERHLMRRLMLKTDTLAAVKQERLLGKKDTLLAAVRRASKRTFSGPQLTGLSRSFSVDNSKAKLQDAKPAVEDTTTNEQFKEATVSFAI